jgi:hypothetical protein
LITVTDAHGEAIASGKALVYPSDHPAAPWRLLQACDKAEP